MGEGIRGSVTRAVAPSLTSYLGKIAVMTTLPVEAEE